MVTIAAFTLAIGVLQMLCLAATFWCLTEVKAMQKSTHSVQFMPADQAFQRVSDEVKESLSRDLFENLQ